MIDWFVETLRSYPEIAIFLSLALGYYFGSFIGAALRRRGEHAHSRRAELLTV